MTAKAERLVNLTVALLAATRPLTFAELRTRMGEWQDGAPASMRRKFERDKDELRSLGVPIETVTTDVLGGEPAYTIDPRRYELPDVELTVAQMTVLAVAFQLVEGGADQLTFSRVAARAPDPDVTDVPAGISVVADDLDPIAPLAAAIVERRVVRFRHRRPGHAPTDRVVAPLAILARRGTWYLRGWDVEREAHRVFRTDRIVSEVELTDEPITVDPDDLDPHEIDELFALPDEVPMTVMVRDGHGGDAWERQELHDRWFRGTARALGAAPDRVIVRPADAHAAVVAGLHAVLAAHGAAP